MKKILPLVFALLLFTFNFPALASAAATLTLSPSTKAVKVGDSVSVSIYFDSGTETTSRVKASITFPVSLLSVETDSIVTTGSAITDFKETIYSNLSGTVNISGDTSTSGSQKLLASVKFKTKALGTANVSFDSGSQIIRASDSSNILSLPDSKGGTYTISTTLTPPSKPQNQATPAVIPDKIGFSKPTYLLVAVSIFISILGIFLIRRSGQTP